MNVQPTFDGDDSFRADEAAHARAQWQSRKRRQVYAKNNGLKGHTFGSLAKQNEQLLNLEATVADTRTTGRRSEGTSKREQEQPAAEPNCKQTTSSKSAKPATEKSRTGQTRKRVAGFNPRPDSLCRFLTAVYNRMSFRRVVHYEKMLGKAQSQADSELQFRRDHRAGDDTLFQVQSIIHRVQD